MEGQETQLTETQIHYKDTERTVRDLSRDRKNKLKKQYNKKHIKEPRKKKFVHLYGCI